MLREIECLLEEPGIMPETMLMSAVAKGHEAVVARLLQGDAVQVNFPDNSERGATALVLAATLGKEKVSQYPALQINEFVIHTTFDKVYLVK